MARTKSLDIVYFVPTPTITAVTPTGGVAGHYTYKLVAVDSAGGLTAASTGTAITTGPTTLDGTHYNTITWTDALKSAHTMIYRTAGGLTQGYLGTVAAGVQTFRDDGIVGDASTPSAANTTGFGAAAPTIELSGLSAEFDGTFTATLQLQGKVNPAASWQSVGAAQTSAGLLDIAATINTLSQVRVHMTAYTSGAPVVVVAGHFEGSSEVVGLPAQTGNSGKFLTTDGTLPAWATVTVPSLGNFSFSGNSEVVPAGGSIDTPGAGTMNIGTANATVLNVGVAGGAVITATNAVTQIRGANASDATIYLSAAGIGGAGKIGFYGQTPTIQQTGVAVSAAGIHAALVALGLITA
jgi:hypothetical protein